MRRRVVHGVFAAAVAACTLAAAVQGWRLHAGLRTQGAMAAAQAAVDAGATDAVPAGADAPAEVRFAAAVALARAGRYEAALDAYKSVTAGEGALRRAALFNLGNLHLREARRDADDPMRTLALVELAKQSFRDLLREDPSDWDARYNLERALWLAPEGQAEDEDLLPPLQAERAATTMRNERGDLP